MRILVVEDERELATAVVEMLVAEHHAVDHAADGSSADELASIHDYDLIILDWNIPPPTGGELLVAWRRAGKATPVLMLTGSRTSVHDRVEGLEHGADDYLTKPFAFAELRARVRNLLRRRDRTTRTTLEAGDLVMDDAARTVNVGGRAVHFSPKEFALLEYLLVRRGEVVPRSELAEHVWDDAAETSSNVIDVLIHRLRKKIDGKRTDRLLHTVPGVGYLLKPDRS